MKQTNEIASFLDFLADAIIIVDEQSNIVFGNRACAKLFGYPRSELLKLKLTDLMFSDTVKGHDAKVKNFIVNKSIARPMMSRNIMPCINSAGQGFNARISIASIVFNGQSCGIATIQDYTMVQELIDDLQNEATTDPLTHLFNKRHLEDLLEKSYLDISNSGCLGVAYLDLNGFKEVNDTLGHDVGDRLLIELSDRLKHHFRTDDLCFRLGGDEFLILFNITHRKQCSEEAVDIAVKIQKLVTTPVWIDKIKQEISVGVSIGLGVLPHDGDKLSEVIAKADSAMYESKANQLPYFLVSDLP